MMINDNMITINTIVGVGVVVVDCQHTQSNTTINRDHQLYHFIITHTEKGNYFVIQIVDNFTINLTK